MAGDDTAAIVRIDRADEAIPALRDRGVYDGDRRIERIDGDRLAVPVTGPCQLDVVERFECGLGLERRLRTLADHLRARGWSAEEVEAAPSSFARIGDLVAVSGPIPHRPEAVGAALLDLHRDCTGVVRIDSIDGGTRRPSVEHVAGADRTRTVHREHGLEYELDLSEVMFSPGNQLERVRMRDTVSPDERVVDLCAGIGYFAVPMAAGGAEVTAFERNPAAYRWLSRNASRNGLDDRLTPVLGDCRGLALAADRAVIGHLPVHDCRDDATAFGGGYLDAALRAVERGWLHVHGIAWAGEAPAAADLLARRLERRDVAVLELTAHRIKGIAPRTDHIVVDASVGPG